MMEDALIRRKWRLRKCLSSNYLQNYSMKRGVETNEMYPWTGTKLWNTRGHLINFSYVYLIKKSKQIQLSITKNQRMKYKEHWTIYNNKLRLTVVHPFHSYMGAQGQRSARFSGYYSKIDSSKIDNNVEFVHSQLYSYVTSVVNLVFVSDKIINNSDNFGIQSFSCGHISAILCSLFSVFKLLYLIFGNFPCYI